MRNKVKDYFGQEPQRQMGFILTFKLFLHSEIQRVSNKEATQNKHLSLNFFPKLSYYSLSNPSKSFEKNHKAK